MSINRGTLKWCEIVKEGLGMAFSYSEAFARGGGFCKYIAFFVMRSIFKVKAIKIKTEEQFYMRGTARHK